MADPSSQSSSLRRLPKQARSKQRVDRILDAAAEVFLEIGYDAATTHIIAARAETAVGSLYQFFPDKFAIFQALELRHIEQGRALGVILFTPAMAQRSLDEFVECMVQQCVRFFDHPAPRAMFLQYFANPSLFRHIDSTFTQEFVKQLSGLLLLMNPALSTETCHLLADVYMQCFNTLMLTALRTDPPYRQQLLSQTQDLLVAYLRPHVQPKTKKS